MVEFLFLDLDDTIFDFLGAYKKSFPGEKNMSEPKITKNVLSLKKDKKTLDKLTDLWYNKNVKRVATYRKRKELIL